MSEAAGAVIVVNFPMPAGARFDWHTHEDHQIAWAPHGVLIVVTEQGRFLLPPTRALWIPVGVRHETAPPTTPLCVPCTCDLDDAGSAGRSPPRCA
ncbi:MAG: AraC family ligand binding domain-containing protein [Acidimicrobiales bacterium]